MATEVIHEHHTDAQGNSYGLIFGIIATVAVILLALYLFRGGFNFGASQTTPEVNVPEQVDVNVNRN